MGLKEAVWDYLFHIHLWKCKSTFCGPRWDEGGHLLLRQVWAGPLDAQLILKGGYLSTPNGTAKQTCLPRPQPSMANPLFMLSYLDENFMCIHLFKTFFSRLFSSSLNWRWHVWGFYIIYHPSIRLHLSLDIKGNLYFLWLGHVPSWNKISFEWHALKIRLANWVWVYLPVTNRKTKPSDARESPDSLWQLHSLNRIMGLGNHSSCLSHSCIFLAQQHTQAHNRWL